MIRTISEPEFATALRAEVLHDDGVTVSVARLCRSVTGPGRSGAIAAVYASHVLGIPFLPFGQPGPGPVLVIDTATKTGATMRKALRRYDEAGMRAVGLAIFDESQGDRVRFWYEAGA